MEKVFTLDGSVKDMVTLGRIRRWMQDEAQREYEFEYSESKIENVVYDIESDSYQFSLVFYKNV